MASFISPVTMSSVSWLSIVLENTKIALRPYVIEVTTWVAGLLHSWKKFFSVYLGRVSV